MHEPPSSAPADGPLAPFVGWPIQELAGDGHCWLTPHGPAVISQATGSRATVELVDTLHDFLDRLAAAGLQRRFPALTLLHDWRSVERVDAGAAQRFRERMDRPGRPFAAYQTYVVTSQSPLALMAMRTGALAHRVLTGQAAVRFVSDPRPIMKEHGIAAPPPGYLEHFLAQR